MKRVALIAAVLVALGAGSAEAAAIQGDPLLQEWSDKAKAPTPLTAVPIHQDSPRSPCPHVAACESQGEVFITAGFWESNPREVFYHELAHVFDPLYLTDADRAWLTSMLGFSAGSPWLDPNNHYTAGEMFASQYAFCAIYGPRWAPAPILYRADWKPVGLRLHRRLCRFIEQAFVR